VFEKALPGDSELVAVTLPRPLGVVFEYEEPKKRAFVAGFVPGGNAEQRQKVGSRCGCVRCVGIVRIWLIALSCCSV